MHQLACVPPRSEASTLSIAERQSPFYGLAAKEKLSGDLGAAAESSLKRIFEATKTPWPRLVTLHVTQRDRGYVELFEGIDIYFGGAISKSLT